MHQLEISGTSEQLANLEKVGEGFLSEGLLRARELSWKAIEEVKATLKPGQRESDIQATLAEVLKKMGSPRAWHRPNVRVGANTTLTFNDHNKDNPVLEADGICFLDIGPNWRLPEFGGLEYEGDVGETFALKANSPYKRIARTAKTLFQKTEAKWAEGKTSGKALYDWLEEEAKQEGYVLLKDIDGHRISEFPHQKYAKSGFNELAQVPSKNLWVLEVHLIDPDLKVGAFYEDILGASQH